MSKRTRWLYTEIERWVSGSIISEEQALRIRALYPESAGGVSWGLIVFSGIGAVVVGLGIILLFAYNWHAIPRFGKLGIVFTTVAAAHAGGLSLAQRDGWRRQLSEALCVLGTMAFGAGIWLVAQIYNIDEHFPDGFLIWGLGALAMAWALQSVPQAILAVVLLVIWDSSEFLRFEAPVSWAPLLIVVGLLPLAWRLRSSLLTVHVLIALYWLLLFQSSYFAGPHGGWEAMYALSALFVAIGFLQVSDPTTAALRRVMGSFGAVGFFLACYARSFRSAEDWYSRSGGAKLAAEGHFHDVAVGFAYHWLPLALAIAAWAYLVARRLRGARDLVNLGDWIYPAALLYGGFLAVSVPPATTAWTRSHAEAGGVYSPPFIVFNLVCLALATGEMVRGCRDGVLRQTVRGSLLFAAVVLARFFDLPGTLASRGVVFIVLGGVLFAEGFYYRKLRREGEGGDGT